MNVGCQLCELLQAERADFSANVGQCNARERMLKAITKSLNRNKRITKSPIHRDREVQLEYRAPGPTLNTKPTYSTTQQTTSQTAHLIPQSPTTSLLNKSLSVTLTLAHTCVNTACHLPIQPIPPRRPVRAEKVRLYHHAAQPRRTNQHFRSDASRCKQCPVPCMLPQVVPLGGWFCGFCRTRCPPPLV